MSDLFGDDAPAIDPAAINAIRLDIIDLGARVTAIAQLLSELHTRLDAALIGVPLEGKKPHVIKHLLTRFDEEFTKRFGERAPIQGAKDAATMKRLLATRDAQRIEELIVAFFRLDDEFVSKSGYTVGVFASQIGKLIVDGATPAKVHGVTANTRDNGRQAQSGAEMIRRSFTHGPEHRR